MLDFQNLHTHTTYCDGVLSPEEMIKAAIKKGYSSIGFSEHSYVPFDIYYSMSMDKSQEYVMELKALRAKYEGIIDVFIGLEQDYHTDLYPVGLDFVIGTLHYVSSSWQYVSVDAGAKNQKKLVEEHFDGDYYEMAEEYYSVIANVIKKTNADIVGHFDLVAKYNINGSLFDEMHPRYLDAALGAMDEILKDCKIFEVNTGAMYRLDNLEPYPSATLLKELCKRGGEVILSSDSHDPESLCYKFGEMQELLKACGFKYLKRLTKDGFIDVKL